MPGWWLDLTLWRLCQGTPAAWVVELGYCALLVAGYCALLVAGFHEATRGARVCCVPVAYIVTEFLTKVKNG